MDKKRLPPRKESFTQAELDAEIDTVRKSLQLELEQLKETHRQELDAAVHAVRAENERMDSALQFAVSDLTNKLIEMQNERDRIADQLPRLEVIISALSQQCDHLVGELRKATSDRA